MASEESIYKCPCCGFSTLSEPPPGTFEICLVCGWEDDAAQAANPTLEGGASRMRTQRQTRPQQSAQIAQLGRWHPNHPQCAVATKDRQTFGIQFVGVVFVAQPPLASTANGVPGSNVFRSSRSSRVS